MRGRKKKQVRKTVRFFKACYAFREPYKVLCDGTFIYRLLEARLGSANDALTSLIGGHTKVFATRCVTEELKKLGEAFSGTVLAARRLTTARCDHELLKSAAECLESMVGSDNPEHFFVATQDSELRRKFRKVPGVPIIFVQKNSLLLEPPSEYQQKIAKLSEEERRHMKEKELKILEVREAKKAAAIAENIASSDLAGNEVPVPVEGRSENKSKKSLGIKDRPRFKRKKAKGPNPLSCKKKKKVSQPSVKINQENQCDTASNGRKRSRHRKRRHHKVALQPTN